MSGGGGTYEVFVSRSAATIGAGHVGGDRGRLERAVCGRVDGAGHGTSAVSLERAEKTEG